MKKLTITFIILGVVFIGTLYFINTQSNQSVYERYGIEDLSVEEMVLALDEQTLDGSIISAGILERSLVINTEEEENIYPVPEDKFYLSFAPYLDNTHPCHNHNLVTCQSELANETMEVTITDDAGDVYLDDEVTLLDNGFYGLWLPSDKDFTINVQYNGFSVETHFGTYENSGTCLTEALKLS